MEDIIKRIHDYTLEDIMGNCFKRYAKEIIQNRALPDVRDGLKPVQRRILYTMYKDHNTYDHEYRKCAKTVGNVMGLYHPHGDSSIYEAMVRMSQWWKANAICVDMQGNNGSMDGDGAAAMRYTEARLAKISNEYLKDIEKGTVIWSPNYDDTLEEPTVLPVKFPAILVNGATGISAGYATNIPPHNLGEVIDATIKRIDSPNCRLETILDIVKGPDFPTGGIVEGKKGIIDAFTTGRGKVIVKSKCEIVKEKGKKQIIVTEIPFDVNKAQLVKKIDEIRIDKKVDGITEVRDETDRDGLRIAVDLKKEANEEVILNYLLKNTELQISYAYNMVAIVNKRPMTLGIIAILDAYIKHLEEVITKRTEYDLEKAKLRMHIVEGLIKALSILDEIIKTIRASKNKEDAKINLQKEYDFTELQADAIVTMQLYKLTNTDVTALKEEHNNLKNAIEEYEKILNNEDELKDVMKNELKAIKKEYAVPRKTEIKDEITEIKLAATDMIAKEDVVVVITHDGYIKRVSSRSYSASDNEPTLKEGDYVIMLANMNTLDVLLLFTDKGNYLYLPVYEVPDLKWKDLGKHISNVIKIDEEEHIINAYPIYDFDETNVTTFTKLGMVKRSVLKDYKVSRYNKKVSAIKLKDKDEVVNVSINNGTEVFISTKSGNGLWYSTDEIPVSGVKSSGVKAINLKNDEVVSAYTFDRDEEYLTVITDKSTGKRVKLTEFEKTTRGKKGVLIIRDVKTNPYHILKTFIVNKVNIGYKVKNDIDYIKQTELPIVDRYSSGTSITKGKIIDAFTEATLIKKEENNVKKEEKQNDKKTTIEDIDKKIYTIDDFLETIEFLD